MSGKLSDREFCAIVLALEPEQRVKALEDRQALTAENERLTQELEEANGYLSRLFKSFAPECEPFDNLAGVCTQIDNCMAGMRDKLAAAQQRLAALAVDPAKRETPQRGLTGPKLPTEFFVCYSAVSREVERTFLSIEAAMQWADRYGDGGFVIHCTAGRFSRDAEINMLETVAGAANQKVAELQRQLAEARKWEGQYKRLHENCDVSHEKTLKQLAEATKRLAELTKPADEEELGGINYTEYYRDLSNPTKAWMNAADAVAARVRGPLVQQIAELNEKLEAAAERIKGQCEQIGNHGRCIVRQRETIKRFKADRDRLAAELATTKQALAANPAASEPIGLCPKCGIQPLTKEGGDMIRLGEKDYLCGNCKRYLCRPIEPKGAASERGDSPHTVETAHTSSSQIAPASVWIRGQQYAWKFNGATQYLELPFTLTAEEVRGLYASLQVAEFGKPADHSEGPEAFLERVGQEYEARKERADFKLACEIYRAALEWCLEKFNEGIASELEVPEVFIEEGGDEVVIAEPFQIAPLDDHSGEANEKVEAFGKIIGRDCEFCRKPVAAIQLDSGEVLYEEHGCDKAEKQNEKVRRRKLSKTPDAEKVEPAETGKVLFCKVCDERSQKRDALKMESEYRKQRDRLLAFAQAVLPSNSNEGYDGSAGRLFVALAKKGREKLEQQLAAANQAREAERQRADNLQKHLDQATAGGQRLAQLHSELEAPWCDKHLDNLPNECPECRAERAEAAVGVMREVLTDANMRLWLHHNASRGELQLGDECGICAGTEENCQGNIFVKIDAALATDPGQAANELRAGKALAGKIRDALCSVEAVDCVERALADYDQALSQSEQRGEGQHGR